MKLTERNTTYFYNAIKTKKKRHRIVSLINHQGSRVTDKMDIQNIVLDFYSQLLGTSCPNNEAIWIGDVFKRAIEEQRNRLMADFTEHD
ncbi:hypothetical protein Dimus_018938, partial [Dionaea muscipula]